MTFQELDTARWLLRQAAIATGEEGWGCSILQSAAAHLDGDNLYPGTVNEAFTEGALN